MKILYAVQGTGNGHITRARHLVDKLADDPTLDVDYFFSGRKMKEYFDMECFGNYIAKRGLTFHTTSGAISYRKTILNNNLIKLPLFYSPVGLLLKAICLSANNH